MINRAVVIFGADGHLGRYLGRFFTTLGREVVAVGQSHKDWSGDGMFIEWDRQTIGPWALALEGAGLVINLDNEGVGPDLRPKDISSDLELRTQSIRVIGEAIANGRVPPRVWMNGGSTDWYQGASDRAQNEWQGEPGTGHSAEKAIRSEEAFFGCLIDGATRKVGLRIGTVLANEPGTMFDTLSRLAKKGLGGIWGAGGQHFSWLHMDDFLAAIVQLEADPMADGIYNLASSESPTNCDLMQIFRQLHGMPFSLRLPKFVANLCSGLSEVEAERLLQNNWVEPMRLQQDGFNWRWKSLLPALENLVARPGLEEFFHIPTRRAVGLRGWTGRRAFQPTAAAISH